MAFNSFVLFKYLLEDLEFRVDPDVFKPGLLGGRRREKAGVESRDGNIALVNRPRTRSQLAVQAKKLRGLVLNGQDGFWAPGQSNSLTQ